MRIGYPCINRSLQCTTGRTFRLRSFSEQRLIETVRQNMACLEEVLRFNAEHGILFFRITSDLVPFASHPVCRLDWAQRFAKEFRRLGAFVRKNGMRISMHPDQFTLLNALDARIVANSLRELEYHAKVLDAMELNTTAKIQLHVGGIYGDREAAIARFIQRYQQLPSTIRRRLVIENDHRLFPLADCMRIHQATGVPILFDTFHHAILNRGETLSTALRMAAGTWRKRDGPLMVDYSSQAAGRPPGCHAPTLDGKDFVAFLRAAEGLNCDVMLEIKDKEKSALRARALVATSRPPPQQRSVVL